MAAITWQNINAPQTVAAVDPSRTLNNSFSFFTDLIKGAEKTQEANWQNTKVNNTNDFMNALYGAKTPQELAQLQATGALNLSKYGAQIDAAAARAALDARPEVLQRREIQGIDHTNKLEDFKAAPLIEQYRRMYVSGDTAGMKAWEAANPTLRGAASAMEAGYNFGQKRASDEHTAAKRPLEIDQMLAQTASSKANAALSGVQLKNANMELADKQETRKLEEALARASTEHLASKNAMGQTQAKIISEMGLKAPLDAQGHPDFNNWQPWQLEAFNWQAKQKGLPTSVDYLSGDTKKANALYESLAKSGQFSPRILNNNVNRILSAFDTAATASTLKGNDAAQNALNTARQEVYFGNKDALNWHAPGSENARTSLKALQDKVPEILGSMENGVWFGDNKKDALPIQSLLTDIATNGIVNKNGDKVLPATTIIEALLKETDGGLGDHVRAKNFKAKLTEFVNSPVGIEMYQEGLKSQAFRDRQKVSELIRGGGQPKK